MSDDNEICTCSDSLALHPEREDGSRPCTAGACGCEEFEDESAEGEFIDEGMEEG